MASLEEDAEALQRRVCDFSNEGKTDKLNALLEEHPEVKVDGCKDVAGRRALLLACRNGHTECARLLIHQRADVYARDKSDGTALHAVAFQGHLSCAKLLVQHGAGDMDCQDKDGVTPLMHSALNGQLVLAQYLLEQKADACYRISRKGLNKNEDALKWSMHKRATDRTPGITFALLSCNTDAKKIVIEYPLTAAMRDAHIETYLCAQAFIDEYHRILARVLSDHVQVDTRVGRGDNGIYQEPLERTLEYLGLSMSKDQVVNTSIDGEAFRRALIPGHLLNANHWFSKLERVKFIAQ
jgi:hypothetical protein